MIFPSTRRGVGLVARKKGGKCWEGGREQGGNGEALKEGGW